MPITCPNCHTENRDTARFCTQCSAPLVAKITCPFCGTDCSAQARFCMNCATPLRGGPVARTGLLPPNTLLQKRYTIVGRVGHGGMGAVYETRDVRITGKRWAVKELSDADLSTPQEKQDAIAAFRQEAQMLALLDHPNLPVVSDFFSEGGKHYLVMEFVDGETLEDKLAAHGGFFDEAQVLEWADQICEVLAYLHGQVPPVIFRDLKPGNVMIDQRGRVKLIDFGIARLFKAGKSTDTQAMGTPGFAAPEQYGKGQTDNRSDIYSLGVLLHQLLTRYDPAHTPFNLPPPDNINPDISVAVVAVIQKATQPKPPDRFQSVQEMRRVLHTPLSPAPTPGYQLTPTTVIAPSTGLQTAVPVPQPVLSSPATSVPQKSYWKAIGWHLFLGSGLFYTHKHAGRKLLYPLVFLVGLFAYIDINELYILSDLVGYDFVEASFLVCAGIYLLSFIDVLLTCQSSTRQAQTVPDKLTWWKALGLHLCFGYGLAYTDSSLRRKWLYPFVFLYGLIAYLDLNHFYLLSDLFGWDFIERTLWAAFGIYLLGFIDVILTSQALSRGSKSVPDNLSWWKALGLQCCFGFGLAYVDSSIRRRWLYPLAFLVGWFAYVDLVELYFLSSAFGIFWEGFMIGLFFIASGVTIFGFIDAILTWQAVSRGSATIPKNLAYWKAIGMHLCFGAGLAYVDSGLRRKWVYPIVFLPIFVKLAYWIRFPFLESYPFGHLYYAWSEFLNISFFIALPIFMLGFLDVFLTCRARLNPKP
jgi:serine/threonine-protein kinase